MTPDYDWAFRTFGGNNVQKNFYSYTQIIYTNGNLDPWSSGGVKEFVNANTPFYLIRGGAHHLDLRLPNDADSQTDVVWVRAQASSIIKRWIIDYQTNHHFFDPSPVLIQ